MNTATRELTPEVLRDFLDYNPETGMFTRIRAADWRNARRVGMTCGSVNKITGYVQLHIAGKAEYAHRLAWIWAHGHIPDGMRVDHINGNRSDNRLSNLRLAKHAENLRNCKVRTDNSSGFKGVSFDKTREQWIAYVGRRRLGRFKTIEAAVEARRAAAAEHFGEFARE